MFLINSRLGLFTATRLSQRVPLLPKLRGYFAEFLNKSSPVRLRIFFSSTCVGLRYGYLIKLTAAFLAGANSRASLPFSVPRHGPAFRHACFYYMPASPLGRVTICALPLSLRVTALFTYSVVQEFQPVVHHLRLSAST